jgi:hypothetical protein
MLFPMLTAEWMHIVLYRIPDRTSYSVLEIFSDIRSEAWLNLFWEYIHGKLFAVYGIAHPNSSLVSDITDG